MRLRLFLLLLLMVFSTSAKLGAQPAAKAPDSKLPTESVTVIGIKSRQAIRGFVQSFTTPSRITGKLARWEDGICPITTGLKPVYANFISQRIRYVAAQVGAPVNRSASCENNIAIIFTTTPQALVDNIRKTTPLLLGYHDNSAQVAQAAKITRPIQAWYTTETRDLDGKSQVDSTKHTGPGVRIPCGTCGAGLHYMYLPYADAWHASGSKQNNGLHTALYDVVIVADPTKLSDYEVGTLADYIALLALSQVTSLDSCQTLPSIVNLLEPSCAAKADALTSVDVAWLKGLYRMSPAAALGEQQDEVSYQMQQSLEGK